MKRTCRWLSAPSTPRPSCTPLPRPGFAQLQDPGQRKRTPRSRASHPSRRPLDSPPPGSPPRVEISMANRIRSRSSERPGRSGFRRGDESPDSRRGRASNEVHPRADRLREDHKHHREDRSESSRAHFSSLGDSRQQRLDEFVDRRSDVRRRGEEAGLREQRRGDARVAG